MAGQHRLGVLRLHLARGRARAARSRLRRRAPARVRRAAAPRRRRRSPLRGAAGRGAAPRAGPRRAGRRARGLLHPAVGQRARRRAWARRAGTGRGGGHEGRPCRSSHHGASDTQGPNGPKERVRVAVGGSQTSCGIRDGLTYRAAETPARTQRGLPRHCRRHPDGDPVARERPSDRSARRSRPAPRSSPASSTPRRRPRLDGSGASPIVTSTSASSRTHHADVEVASLAGAEVELDVLLDAGQQVMERRDEQQAACSSVSARKRGDVGARVGSAVDRPGTAAAHALAPRLRPGVRCTHRAATEPAVAQVDVGDPGEQETGGNQQHARAQGPSSTSLSPFLCGPILDLMQPVERAGREIRATHRNHVACLRSDHQLPQHQEPRSHTRSATSRVDTREHLAVAAPSGCRAALPPAEHLPVPGVHRRTRRQLLRTRGSDGADLGDRRRADAPPPRPRRLLLRVERHTKASARVRQCPRRPPESATGG